MHLHGLLVRVPCHSYLEITRMGSDRLSVAGVKLCNAILKKRQMETRRESHRKPHMLGIEKSLGLPN